MDNDTTGVSDATVLLDLDGLRVESVERAVDGSRLVRLVTADEAAAACPRCGVFAFRLKEYVHTSPRDLPCGGGGRGPLDGLVVAHGDGRGAGAGRLAGRPGARPGGGARDR